MTKCGYVALLGRPNAGKSTLLNALVGDKLAVVSRKPQTTRNRILGIALSDKAQLLFLDTPGLHRNHGKLLLNSVMNKVALQAAAEADLLVYLIDPAFGFTEEDAALLSRCLDTSDPKARVALIASKVDSLTGYDLDRMLPDLDKAIAFFFADPAHAKHKERCLSLEPFPVSGKRPEEVAMLRDLLADQLPEGPWLFPEDDLTDRPRSFISSELIREQLFRQLGEEIPYGSAVQMQGIDFKPNIVVVLAQIVVAKASQKPIVVGKAGARIKAIGAAARESLEKHFDKKVFLDLTVTVSEGWNTDESRILELAQMHELDMKLEMRNEGHTPGSHEL